MRWHGTTVPPYPGFYCDIAKKLVISAAAKAAPGGNSVNAKRCQKGAQKAM